MVNRVFCYSKEVAKKNGNRLPVLELVLVTILFTFFIIVSAVMFESVIPIMISTIIFIALIIYYSVLLGIRMRNRMVGYATDNNGRIFKVAAINNGQGLYFGGLGLGGMIDQLIGNDSNTGRNLGGAIGAAAQFYSMNRSAEYMSHPEIIAKIVEESPNVTGAVVYEILKVYSIIDNKKSIKINCDYKIVGNDKINYNKKLTIEKSYNMYEDLINELRRHQ